MVFEQIVDCNFLSRYGLSQTRTEL